MRFPVPLFTANRVWLKVNAALPHFGFLVGWQFQGWCDDIVSMALQWAHVSTRADGSRSSADRPDSAHYFQSACGADVVLYLTVISFLLSFFYLLHSVESQREQITLLVRRIALQNPVSLQYPTHKDDESNGISSLSDPSSPSCAQV